MDPYLQGRWPDVHAKLIAYIGETLTPLLPRDLRARSEERVVLESIEGESLRRYRGDVAVVEASRAGEPGSSAVAATATATIVPVIIEFSDEPYVDRFVQIVDLTNGGKVVTAIEVLSPWNKAAGRLNEDYLRKLSDYARAGVSVVEIDLLRGSRSRIVTANDLPPDRRSAYTVCVRRGWLGNRWEAYPIPLQQRLPPIPIPLRQSDSDVLLELQPLIDRVYLAGGHDDIDYRKPAEPPLEAADAAWAAELLRSGAPQLGV